MRADRGPQTEISEEALAKLCANHLATILAAEATRSRQLRRDLELALQAEREAALEAK